jgi:hypothetical protein
LAIRHTAGSFSKASRWAMLLAVAASWPLISTEGKHAEPGDDRGGNRGHNEPGGGLVRPAAYPAMIEAAIAVTINRVMTRVATNKNECDKAGRNRNAAAGRYEVSSRGPFLFPHGEEAGHGSDTVPTRVSLPSQAARLNSRLPPVFASQNGFNFRETRPFLGVRILIPVPR